MAKDETITDEKEIAFCDGDIGYSGIVEHINDGVVIIKDGKIVFANKAFCEICRKSPLKISWNPNSPNSLPLRTGSR